MNRIFELSARSSVICKRLNVPLRGEFKSVGLIGFYSTFLTPNITTENNKLYYEDETGVINSITIPPGQYNLENIQTYIQKQKPFTSSNIKINENKIMNRVTIVSDFKLYFNKTDSIGILLGFKNQTVEPKKVTIGNRLPKVIPFENIRVHFNLADGMFVKGSEHFHRETNIIASFKPDLVFSAPIIYEPSYPIFCSVSDYIQNLKITVTDEHDELIDFAGARVTIILEMK